MYKEFILKRHEKNPIITPDRFDGAEAVFNPGQTVFNGKPLLLVSITHRSGSYRGIAGATTHVAESEDGITFKIRKDPFLQTPTSGRFKNIDGHPIDTRITKIEDTYYIAHAGCSEWGTVAILGKTKDFENCEYMDIISLPDNRVPCLFSEKINGKYLRVDRPYRVGPNGFQDAGNLWISYSPDLIHWGEYQPLLRAGFAPWGSLKIGPTPPIKTDAGWLMIIHGVRRVCTSLRYSLGAVLLDLDDPSQIIGLTNSPILAPFEQYELTGIVPNVVFSCGAIPDYKNDRISLYYGAADTSIGLATGSISELIDACLKRL